MVAEVQKRGGIAGFIDAEHALDPVYAKSIGVDIDNLYISQPDNGEQALEITETMVRSGAVDIVIVDSVAALVPKAEIEGDMGDSHVGLQARLMSQALRKLTAVISKSNCVVIFINQLREKVGVMFGNPETTTGGRALKFSPEAVEDAIAYVKSYGYINDARYARTYISFRMETRSRQKILSELQLKGVDRQTALDAWNEMEELMEPDEREVLRRTIEKKYAPDTELDEGQMRRLYGYLARRAFRYEDISHTLEEMNIRVNRDME